MRAEARGRESLCEAIRVSYAPTRVHSYASLGKGLVPPVIHPGGSVSLLGVCRSFLSTAKDSAPAEAHFSRVLDARYGYLAKYNVPGSTAVAAPVAPKASPPAFAQQPLASKTGVATAASLPLPRGKYRPRSTPEAAANACNGGKV